MLQSQVAGRHGSYATQFWRSSGAPHYRSRAAMRTAYSRKALNRRLVLPLDSHNWVRSLEVLNACYARLGRTPEHYQAVLRDMVQHHGAYAELTDRSALRAAGKSSASETGPSHASASSVVDVVGAMDGIRDRAFAGEIPSNASLWVTFVWSYCTLQRPQEALETFEQARRRFRLSGATLQHMAELLLPVLCQHGQLAEATALYETYLQPDRTPEKLSRTAKGAESAGVAAATATSSSGLHRSGMDDAEARRWLAEAAARQGDWKKTQEFSPSRAGASAQRRSDGNRVGSSLGDEERSIGVAATRPTLNSLFHNEDMKVVKVSQSNVTLHNFASRGGALDRHQPQPSTSIAATHPTIAAASLSFLPQLATLSPIAVRRLFHSLSREGAAGGRTAGDSKEFSFLTDALACWEHLYGPLPGIQSHISVGRLNTSPLNSTLESDVLARPAPPLQDVHELLNLLAAQQEWKALLEFFTVVFLHQHSSHYLDAAPHDLVTHTLHNDTPVGDGVRTSAQLFPYSNEVPLDAVTLNLVFACLPKAAEPLSLHTVDSRSDSHSRVLQLPAAARPVAVVRLLDDLLLHRDDMELTDVVMSIVGPALLQVGQADRVFELLVRTPMMVRGRERKAAVALSPYEQQLKALLVSLGYAAYAVCAEETTRAAMVRKMPHLFPPEVVHRLAARTARETGGQKTVSSSSSSSTQGALAVLGGPVVLRVEARMPSSEEVRDDVSSEPSSPSEGNAHAVASASTPSLLDLKWRPYNAAARHGGGDHVNKDVFSHAQRRDAAHSRGRPSSLLTSMADDAMRRDFLRLHEHRTEAFTGSHADAERDPRPIPKGLHDHASGWDFFGRGGEKAFENHKRTPHPFTMQPKVMRDLRNPYRGWNPRKNSSLAHKENVIKWNGKSAV